MALPAPTLVLEADGSVVTANDPALAWTGHTTVAGLSFLDLFDRAHQGAAGEVLGQVNRGEQWRGELPLLLADGSLRPTRLTLNPYADQFGMAGAVMCLEELDTPVSRAAVVADRLTRLTRATAALLGAETLEATVASIIGHMAEAAGATVASVAVPVEDGRMRLLGLRGGPEGLEARWRTFDPEGTPIGDALASRRPVLLDGRAAIESRYPGLELAVEGERSLVCLPLIVRDRVLGAVNLSFPGRRGFGDVESDFFGVLADVCAQSLDRAQVMAAVADKSAKLQFLADVTAELSASLDYEATLGQVAKMAIPWFADWCSISLMMDGELKLLVVEHPDPAKVALALEFNDRFPPDPDIPRGVHEVIRTGQSELMPEITDELLDEVIADDEHRQFIRDLNLYSGLTVPLKVADRVLGAITWVTGENGRRFTEEDQRFGEELGRRAAIAIDNSLMHTQISEMAVRLQRAILPGALPHFEGWDVATHYSPTGRLEAGGDFYDVFALPDGRMALFVGDVMGRGVQAAAAMAQMRSSVRALAALDPTPAVVLEGLDRIFEHYELTQLVTMVYALADPRSDLLSVANAGHLPPVLLRAGRVAEFGPSTGQLLLGAGHSERSSVDIRLGPGDLVLLYTDGLVERRGEGLDAGLERLLAAAPTLGDGDLARALAALAGLVSDPLRDDDVALLALRRGGAAPGSASGR